MPLKCDVVDDNPCWGEVTLSDVDYAEDGEPIEYYACEGHRYVLGSGEYVPEKTVAIDNRVRFPVTPVLQTDDRVPADTKLEGTCCEAGREEMTDKHPQPGETLAAYIDRVICNDKHANPYEWLDPMNGYLELSYVYKSRYPVEYVTVTFTGRKNI